MRIVSALALILSTAAPLAAQDAGAVVSGSIGVTDTNGRGELTYTGSAGYRFNRYVGLEIEVTAVPTLKGTSTAGNNAIAQSLVGTTAYASVAALVSPTILPALTYTNPNGRAVIFTNNVRVELPTSADRLTPFFVAGGGVASIRRTQDVTIPILYFDPLPLAATAAIISPPIKPIVEHFSSSSTNLTLTIGGGIAVRIASHTTIDADLRLYEFLDATDSNAGRFTVGVRYRF